MSDMCFENTRSRPLLWLSAFSSSLSLSLSLSLDDLIKAVKPHCLKFMSQRVGFNLQLELFFIAGQKLLALYALWALPSFNIHWTEYSCHFHVLVTYVVVYSAYGAMKHIILYNASERTKFWIRKYLFDFSSMIQWLFLKNSNIFIVVKIYKCAIRIK